MLKVAGERLTLVALAVRNDFRCGICSGRIVMGDTGPYQPTVDHILPLSRGGENHSDNLQVAHMACNVLKRDRVGFTCDPVESGQIDPQGNLFDP